VAGWCIGRRAYRFPQPREAFHFVIPAIDPQRPDEERDEIPVSAAGPRGLVDFARIARQAGDVEAAVSHYREAQFLDPDDAAIALESALYLAELGRHRESVEILERCVRRHPELPAARFHLGTVWRQLAEPEKAAQQLRRYLALEPEDRLGAAAELDALAEPTTELPAAYLRSLFDQYADEFDRNLVKDLDYRAPEILRQAVDRCWRAPAAGADVLDLGCGTGLGGAAFRDVARRMHGVDLSPRMIERASARGIYESLAVGEAVASLRAETAAWDLVVAADVLVYLGDLAPLFAAARQALKPGGALAATVEAADGTEPALKPTRRFGHPADYLRRAAAVAGLIVALLEPASTRTEKGEPVAGHVMVLINAA
jgi:predicted TPR repeat methyltransferase